MLRTDVHIRQGTTACIAKQKQSFTMVVQWRLVFLVSQTGMLQISSAASLYIAILKSGIKKQLFLLKCSAQNNLIAFETILITIVIQVTVHMYMYIQDTVSLMFKMVCQNLNPCSISICKANYRATTRSKDS
jgi:hypothetical protein